MDILLSGFHGAMGQNVLTLTQNEQYGIRVTAGVDKDADGTEAIPCAKNFQTAKTDMDAVVDFSHRSLTADLVDFCVKNRLPLVIATTGQTEDELKIIREAADDIPIFFAPNYSLGIALLIELAKQTAAAMPNAEIEIVEIHHSRKADAPSGTALALADAVKSVRPELHNHCGRAGMEKRSPDEIGIHSLRMGNVVGEHEVIVATPLQTITLKHEAHSRALFAEGALTAAKFLIEKPNGLYNMNDLIQFNAKKD